GPPALAWPWPVCGAGVAGGRASPAGGLGFVSVAGPAIFLLVGVRGSAVAAGFLASPAGLAKPLILFIEAFMVLSVAAILPLLVVRPPTPLSVGRPRPWRRGICAGWPGGRLTGHGVS